MCLSFSILSIPVVHHFTFEIFILLNEVQISQYAKSQLTKFIKTRQLNRVKVLVCSLWKNCSTNVQIIRHQGTHMGR